MAAFEKLGLIPELIQSVHGDMDWLLPRDVQDEAIPLILGGGDVLIAAETGSGKTGAFALPVVQLIYESLRGEAEVTPLHDTKTPSGAGAANEPVKLNVNDRFKQCAVSDNMCQMRDARIWGGVRATKGYGKGRFYYEAKVNDDGLCRVGWATKQAGYECGKDNQSFGYGGTAMKAHARKFDKYGEVYENGDVIGCCLDLESDTKTVSYTKNGRNLGVAFRVPNHLQRSLFYPAVCMKNAEMILNFGETDFAFQPPRGYVGCYSAPSHLTSDELSDAVDRGGGGGGGRGGEIKSPMCIILEPTRELAQQVYDQLESFTSYLVDPHVKAELFIGGGGASYGKMVGKLKSGNVHILVGTMGIMSSIVNKMNFRSTRYLILDEADSLIDQGGKATLMKIYNKLPKETGLQVVICSATLHSPGIQQLADTICVYPTWVDLKGKDSVPESVDHCLIMVDPRHDSDWRTEGRADYEHDQVHHTLTRSQAPRNNLSTDWQSLAVKLLKPQILLQVIDQFQMDQCMIFCRTQVDCDQLADFLVRAGGGSKFTGKRESGKEGKYSCAVFHGGRMQKKRFEALNAFKEGDVRFLITSDAGARGLDIKALPFVINMTLPDMIENYIHRIGRVGRADEVGLAISLVSTVKERVWWHTCDRKDRGRGCRQTDLKSQGGCTIWYDEPRLVKDIEARLGGIQIPKLNKSQLNARRVLEMAAKARKGKSGAIIKSERHVEILRPTVEHLADLEVGCQHDYHMLAHQHANQWAARLAGDSK